MVRSIINDQFNYKHLKIIIKSNYDLNIYIYKDVYLCIINTNILF